MAQLRKKPQQQTNNKPKPKTPSKKAPKFLLNQPLCNRNLLLIFRCLPTHTVHSWVHGKDNYKRITMQHADSPSISHSTPTPPNVWGPQNPNEVKVTKITKLLFPLWKLEVGRGDPKEFPHQRGKSWPHPTQVWTALTPENPSLLAAVSQRTAGALAPGEEGHKQGKNYGNR